MWVDGYINKITHYIIYEEKSGIYETSGNCIYVRIFVVCNMIKEYIGQTNRKLTIRFGDRNVHLKYNIEEK